MYMFWFYYSEWVARDCKLYYLQRQYAFKQSKHKCILLIYMSVLIIEIFLRHHNKLLKCFIQYNISYYSVPSTIWVLAYIYILILENVSSPTASILCRSSCSDHSLYIMDRVLCFHPQDVVSYVFRMSHHETWGQRPWTGIGVYGL